MRIRQSFAAVLVGALTPGTFAVGHPSEGISPQQGPVLAKRAGAGAGCGPSAGNAICNAGLCCSEGVGVYLSPRAFFLSLGTRLADLNSP